MYLAVLIGNFGRDINRIKKMKIIDLRDEPQHIPLLAQWHQNEWSYLNPSLSLEARIRKMEQYLINGIIPSTFVAKDGNTILGSAALVEQK